MMKRIFNILLLLLAAYGASANDGVYYTSGNQLVPLKETDISVKKEILTISLQDDGFAKVDVYYEFHNPGTATKSVTMGFEADPPYNYDNKFYPSGKHPHIRNFVVEANGQTLTYKNGICEMDGSVMSDFIDVTQYKYNDEYNRLVDKSSKDMDDTGIDFAYVYYFTMDFKPGKNIVHHTYEYTMSVTVGTSYEVPYKLSPAGRWANHQIDDFTLIIRADNTAKHFVLSPETFGNTPFAVTEGRGKIRKTTYYDIPYYEFALRNGAVTIHKNGFVPNPESELHIMSADYLYTFNEDSRFGDFYDRSNTLALGQWQYNDNHKQKLPKALFKRIAKNLPFANRGHVFKDAELKKYFSSLWWYMPDESYKDDTSGFTKSDWEYVNEGK